MIIEAPPPQGAFGQKAVRRKAARVIHDSLQRYCAWAARDGGYDKLKVIPNLIAEVVDAPETQESLVKYMNDRMGDLSRLQREFYRADHDRSLWSPARARLARKDKRSLGRLDKSSGKIVRAGLKRGFLSDDTTPPSTPGLSWDSQTASTPGSTPRLPSAKRRRYGSPSVDDRTMMDDYYLQSPDIKADMDHEASMSFKSEVSMVDEVPLANVAPRPSTPINEDEIMYRRQPPVVYGLFIIGTSIFLLTADSSKGEDAYISFHVDMDFADKFQSVWNALTVAIAVCSARDELMSRLDDFAPTTSVYDSDPDA